jgi:hypothetical protein
MRTVTACLRVMGLSHEQQFQAFHRVLSTARSGWLWSRALKLRNWVLGVRVPSGHHNWKLSNAKCGEHLPAFLRAIQPNYSQTFSWGWSSASCCCWVTFDAKPRRRARRREAWLPNHQQGYRSVVVQAPWRSYGGCGHGCQIRAIFATRQRLLGFFVTSIKCIWRTCAPCRRF